MINWIFSAFLLVVLFGAGAYCLSDLPPGNPIKNSSDFWSSFNALTALFTGLAFVVIWKTLEVQKKDIERIKNEAKYSKVQSKIYELLDFHQKQLSEFTYTYNHTSDDDPEADREYSSYKAISFLLSSFKETGTGSYTNGIREEDGAKLRNLRSEAVKDTLEMKVLRNNFVFLDSIIECLRALDKNSFLTKKEVKDLLRTIQGRMTKDELIIFFYYVHGFHEDDKPLLEKFAFFENLDSDELFDWRAELALYKIEAYGSNETLQSGFWTSKKILLKLKPKG